jgi:hypothetical protein
VTDSPDEEVHAYDPSVRVRFVFFRDLKSLESKALNVNRAPKQDYKRLHVVWCQRLEEFVMTIRQCIHDMVYYRPHSIGPEFRDTMGDDFTQGLATGVESFGGSCAGLFATFAIQKCSFIVQC